MCRTICVYFSILPFATAQAPTAPPPALPPVASPQDGSATSSAPSTPVEAPKPTEWPKDVQGRNLIECLNDTNSTDPAIRQNAVQLLPYFGPDARRPSLPVLIRLSTDPDPGVRISTYNAIALFAFDSEADQRKLFEAMRVSVNNSVSGSAVRLAAIRAWGSYGPDAGITIPVMDPLKTDVSWETRYALANALGRIGSPIYEANPSLDTSGRPVPRKPGYDGTFPTLRYLIINDKCAFVRLEAVSSLILIGVPNIPNPVEYLRTIAPQLDLVNARLPVEKDKAVQIWLYVLRVMYDERALNATLPKIAAYLRDQDLSVRAQSLQAVGALGAKAYTLLPEVRDCLKSYTEPIMLAAALGCIRAMGKEASGVLQDVEEFRDRTTNEELKKQAESTIDALKGIKKAPMPTPMLTPGSVPPASGTLAPPPMSAPMPVPTP